MNIKFIVSNARNKRIDIRNKRNAEIATIKKILEEQGEEEVKKYKAKNPELPYETWLKELAFYCRENIAIFKATDLM